VGSGLAVIKQRLLWLGADREQVKAVAGGWAVVHLKTEHGGAGLA